MTKVCHLSQDEKGMQKKITEHYLVDSESFTESESRTVKEVGECSVTTIRKTNIKEVFEGTGDYYKVRVDFLTLDENTGREQRTGHTVLVQAPSVRKALDCIDQNFASVRYEVTSLQRTPIAGVIADS